MRLRYGCVWVGLAWATAGEAQGRSGPQPEVRLDAIAAREPTGQLGIGATLQAGTYVRWGIIGGIGAAERGGSTVGTARVDGILRFHLDPFRESRVGLYGIAGASAMDDGSRQWEPRILLGVGIEGRRRRGVVTAAELSLGGGARLAVVVRRARANRR